MARLILLLCGISCFSLRCWCQQKDSIILYNGQVLIGEVQGASLGSVSIDDIDLKMQSIKLYKIRRIKISKMYKIETVSKRLYFGFLEMSEKDGWITIIPDMGAKVSMPITSLQQLIQLNKGFFKRLDGNLSAGFSYSKSSGIGQVNLSTTVGFATRLFEYQLQGSEIGTIDSSKFSRDNENLQFFASYDLSSTWFVAGDVQYQRNIELSIGRRYLELLGAGNKLFIKDNWQLLAVTGMTFTQEKSTEGGDQSLAFEIPLMFRFNFYQFQHPNIQITTSQTMYISLSDKGRVRYDGNTSFSWELIRYFYLTLSPYSSFDSKPPSGSGSKFDFGLVLSLTYKF